MNRFITALLSIGVFVIISMTTAVTLSSPAHAVSGDNFKPGRIIDDAVFYNPDSINADQIQSFLNSKNPNCDYNGTQPASDWGRSDLTHAVLAQYIREGSHGFTQNTSFHAPPYRCLTKYTQSTPQMEAASGYCNAMAAGNRTAAQIIKDVSAACGVNPQVLLVLLEKEQSLVTDDWPLNRQLQNATGFACPDSAPCNPQYEGLFYQIYYAARQFKVYQANPNNYNYIAGRTNKIYWQTNLGNFVNTTGNVNDPSRSGQSACGYNNVYIENQATAGLYIYTPYQPNKAALANMYGTGDGCSAYGNRNFWRIFNDWFGLSTNPPPTKCNSKVNGTICVWSVRKGDGSQFLTSSESELISTINDYGWTNEGIAFYASETAQSGTTPVYRLRQNNLHYFTADLSEYTTLKNSGSWTDEGIRFYAVPLTASNTSYTTYKLHNLSNGQYYLTTDVAQKNMLLTNGYTLESSTFNTFSGSFPLPSTTPLSGRDNVYRLRAGSGYFYTTDLNEIQNVAKLGYAYEGVLTTVSPTPTSTPVYRLYGNGEHFYTTDAAERDEAVSRYGFRDEGIRFYLDSTSSPIYRLINTVTGKHLFTSTISEAMSLANVEWKYEKMLATSTASLSPVYRFVNLYNGRHFFTLETPEAASIANKGWKYETVAFYTSATTGVPVYGLYGKGEHFYTTDAAERDAAVSTYGFNYEKVRFYANNGVTSVPVYRLYGNGEHFYTTDAAERDAAVSRYGFRDEGIRFYLTPAS